MLVLNFGTINPTKMSIQAVEKRSSISYQEFVEEHLKKGIPVVFKNASDAWPKKSFDPEFFEQNFGDRTIKFEGRTYNIKEILELIKNSTPENPAPYPISFEVPEDLPDFMKLINPIHMNYATPNWFQSDIFPYGKFGKNINLFFGGQGNQYSLHKDFYHTNAWITQLHGRKKFVLFPGDQDEFLYAGKDGYSNFLSPVNIMKPDYEKYPKYMQAKSLEVILSPGETLFIPNGIWHTTVAEEANISLIFDQLNHSNYNAWRKDMFHIKKNESLGKAVLNYGFAVAAGTTCRLKEYFKSK